MLSDIDVITNYSMLLKIYTKVCLEKVYPSLLLF